MLYALLGAAIIGLTLGLLGAGGSILTIPILHYLVHHDGHAVFDEAFAIVGAISLAAALRTARQGRVRWDWVLIFGIAGLFGALLGERVVSLIPDGVRFILLALVMVLAAALMFRQTAPPTGTARVLNPALMIALGVGFGALTKVVGVGGGFLIVPTLVILGGLTMHLAVGTSLPIIALNSASSLAMSLAARPGRAGQIDWITVAMFAAVGIAGSLVGTSLGGRLDQRTLKRVFAVFLLGIAAYTLWRELPRMIG